MHIHCKKRHLLYTRTLKDIFIIRHNRTKDERINGFVPRPKAPKRKKIRKEGKEQRKKKKWHFFVVFLEQSGIPFLHFIVLFEFQNYQRRKILEIYSLSNFFSWRDKRKKTLERQKDRRGKERKKERKKEKKEGRKEERKKEDKEPCLTWLTWQAEN